MTDDGAPRLVLGPMLRYVSETEATIWVETDRACRAEILGHAARTFEVAGHHYALVVIGGPPPRAHDHGPGPQEANRAAPAPVEPARLRGRGLRRVLLPLPRGVERALGALAALGRPHRDDLRRPRRARRLEHLGRLAP